MEGIPVISFLLLKQEHSLHFLDSQMKILAKDSDMN